MVKKYNLPFNVEYIIHCADIHIRNLRRHDEYLIVFENLYTKIKELIAKNPNTLIYVGGDIAHAKTDISPELVSMMALFFNNLADLAPTIVITGNHDCNLNNLDRMDVIEPVINAIKHPNLYYLKESGIYKFNNIDFAVFSIFDDVKNYPKALECENEHSIALYHGTVQNCIMDTGLVLNGDESELKLKFLSGFDFCLLGDIHKMQFLNKSKTIAYCGSLIQQNFGEDFYNHGVLYWDLKNKKSEFIKIKNPYGYFVLRIKNGIIENEVDIPENPRIKIQSYDTEKSTLKLIVSELKTKYNVKDIIIDSIDSNKIELSNNKTHESIIGDITDHEHQYTLISDYLNSRYNTIDSDIFKKIHEINFLLNSELNKNDITKNYIWKLKKLEFSNMTTFGPNNIINFEKMDGVYGLFAPNRSGKCVDPNTEIEIEYDEDEIINKLGFLPEELKNKIKISEIYDIFQEYGDLNIKVNTPYGYKHIEACDITAPNSDVMRVETTAGLSVDVSPDHKIKLENNEFIKTKNLKINDSVQTINGTDLIKQVTKLDYKKDLMDIQVADVHQYYSNGIVSHNSSIIEILLFMLYDRGAKVVRSIDIMNVDSNECYGKLTIELNGKDYFIEKIAYRKTHKNSAKVNTNFWTTDENNKILMLNGDQRRSTNQIISDYVGTLENLVSTSVSLQHDQFGLIDKSNSDRKNILSQFLGIDIFEELFQKAKEGSKELKLILKEFNNKNFELDLSDNNRIINDNTIEYKKLQKEFEVLTDEKTECNTKIIDLSKKLKNTHDALNISVLNENKNNLSNKLKQLTLEEEDKLKEKNELMSTGKKIINELAEYDIDDLNTKKIINDELLVKQTQTNNTLEKLHIDLLHKKQKLDKLKDLEYDPKCTFCMNNVFVKDAIETKKQFDDDKKNYLQVSSSLSIVTTDIENLKQSIVDYNLIKTIETKKIELKNKFEKIKLNEQNIEVNKKLIEEKINKNNSDIELYEQNEKDIEFNKRLNIDITKYKQSISDLDIKIKNYEIKIRNLYATISSAETKRNWILQEIDNIKQYEIKYKAYEYYLEAIHRDGIQYELIKK